MQVGPVEKAALLLHAADIAEEREVPKPSELTVNGIGMKHLDSADTLCIDCYNLKPAGRPSCGTLGVTLCAWPGLMPQMCLNE